MPTKPRVVTIEEHYQDPDVVRTYAPEDQRQLPAIAERLNDLTDLPKIEDMAEALGFDPPARLFEQTPAEEMLPLEEQDAT